MRDVVLSLATVAVYIAVGCADSVVEVRGRVVDTDSQPFERCEVLLYQGASPKVLDTAVVTGGINRRRIHNQRVVDPQGDRHSM